MENHRSGSRQYLSFVLRNETILPVCFIYREISHEIDEVILEAKDYRERMIDAEADKKNCRNLLPFARQEKQAKHSQHEVAR